MGGAHLAVSQKISIAPFLRTNSELSWTPQEAHEWLRIGVFLRREVELEFLHHCGEEYEKLHTSQGFAKTGAFA